MYIAAQGIPCMYMHGYMHAYVHNRHMKDLVFLYMYIQWAC